MRVGGHAGDCMHKCVGVCVVVVIVVAVVVVVVVVVIRACLFVGVMGDGESVFWSCIVW